MRKDPLLSLSFPSREMIDCFRKTFLIAPIFLLLTLLYAGSVSAQANKIDPQVARQIQSLLDEKASRTEPQKKMSSQLLYSFKMRNGQRITPEVASLRVNVTKDAQGRVKTELDAIVSPQLLSRLRALGCEILETNEKYGSILANIPLDKLEEVAALVEIKHLNHWVSPMNNSERPAKAGTTSRADAEVAGEFTPAFNKKAENVRKELNNAFKEKDINGRFVFEGSVTSQADVTHKAVLARNVFGTDGTGVKIGVLSNGVTGFEAAIASGDLPPFTIIPGQAGTGSEGWAMMELIHDLAPGAELFYATAFSTPAQFATNILALRAAGCDIIVDDVTYFNEGVFQDDVVAQAVNTVTADGAIFFSSAGNSGNENDNTSGVWEGDFVDAGASVAPLPLTGTFHNFSGGTVYNTLTGAGRVTLKWSDPLGLSANDYDFFVTNAAGTVLEFSGTGVQDGNDQPYEDLGNCLVGERLYIIKKTGAATRALHLNTHRGRLTFHTPGVVFGHNAAASTYSVAATPVASPFGMPGSPTGPYPGVFNSSNTLEVFSSDGPRRVFYLPDGSPITPGNVLFGTNGGTVLAKPDITAGDGAVTTTPGFIPFYGTSAAAPHAAAITALIKSKLPGLTPAQIRNLLISTAIDIEAPGFDRDAGAGIIMAYEALAASGAAAVSHIEAGTVTATEIAGNGNGAIEPGDEVSLTVQLNNLSPVSSTNVNAVLTSTTPGITVTQNSAGYGDIAGNSSAVNTATPYLFSIASQVACGTIINFTLTVTYGGGGPSPKALNFTLKTGYSLAAINASLGTAPPSGVGYTATAGLQTNRLNRNGVIPTCAGQKATPVLQEAAPGTSKAYHAYTFTNTSSSSTCVTVSIVTSGTASLTEVVYGNGGFNPANVQANYLADQGTTNNATPFSFNAPAGQQFTVVVHEVNTGGGVGVPYSLKVDYAICLATPVIINASSPVVVTAENAIPANNAPDPGETVTVNLPLINIGSGNSSNLVATLQPTGGVTNPSGAQNYGVVIGGGTSVTRPYTFTASGNCGDNITLTLQLQDGAADMGTISYTLRLGTNQLSAPTTFSNTTPITIPGTGTGAVGGAPANPYSSDINVSGMTGTISKITIGLKQFSHTYPDDVGVLLVSPTGQKMIIMSQAGSEVPVTNIDITLDDAAATILPAAGAIATGTYPPMNVSATGDAYVAPAPVGPYLSPAPFGSATLASAFNGQDPNGTWKLFVIDNAGGDVGNFNGGWELRITTATSVCSALPPSLSINDVTLAEGTAGATTYSFTVSLSSPALAGGVSFDIATQNNTATTANNDYVAKSLTSQTIPEGSSTYTFDVTVNGDITVELNESFFVNLSNVTGAIVSDGQGLGIISNDDAAIPSLLVLSSSTNPSCASNTLIFSAILVSSGPGSEPIPGQTVTFSISGPATSTLSATTNASGTAAVVFPGSNFNLAGNYFVNASFAGSSAYSQSSASIFQVVNPIPATPTVSANGPTSFCAGGSVILSSSAASGNQWYKNGNILTGETNQTYTATASGTYTVQVTNSGCPSSASSGTVVSANVDITPPVAPSFLPALVTECSATLTAPTAEDDCAGIITGTTTTIFPITAQGTTTVTWTFNDGNGNTSTATQNVTIEDITPPSAPASLPPFTSECSATPVAPTAEDNCAGTLTGSTTTVFPITTLGTTTVIWTFNDGHGNASSVSQQVTVTDNTPPVPPTSLPTISGLCFANVTAPTAIDNCAGTITGTTTTTLPVTTPGTTVITWTFNDGNGNSSTATQTLTVAGPQPPTITCPADATAVTAGNNCTATITIGAATTTTTCASIQSLTWVMTGATTGSSPATGVNPFGGSRTFNVGITTITQTLTNSVGMSSSCSFTVTVTDQQPPVVVCPAPISQSVSGSNCSRQITVPNATASDNCGVTSLTWVMTGATTGSSAAAGINNVGTKTFNTGVTTITYTTKDAAGNTGICSFTVTVIETVLPSITCPGARTVNADWGYCHYSASNLQVPQVSDNCGVASLTHDAPAFIPVGVTNITWTVTDRSGNTRRCTQKLTVVDAQNPEVTSPANIRATTNGSCNAVVTTPNPTYFDNCGVTKLTWKLTGATTGSSPTTGINFAGTRTFNVGVTTITYTVTDAAGRTASSWFSVVVTDEERPTLVCPSNITQTAANGACSRSIAVPNPTYGDNCSVTKLTWYMTGATSVNSGNNGVNLIGTRSFNVGVTTVTYSIWDAANNTRSCTFTVTVTDAQSPVITCPAARTLCKNTSNSYSLPSLIASDNCGLASTVYAITGATTRSGSGLNAGGLFNLGVSTITWTVTDFNGNVTMCSTTVTIVSVGTCENVRVSDPAPNDGNGIHPGMIVEKLEATAYPNPSGSFFNLRVKTYKKETVEIRMFDMMGKVVEVQRGAPGQTFKLGGQLIAGMYMIEVVQAGEKVLVKVLKE